MPSKGRRWTPGVGSLLKSPRVGTVHMHAVGAAAAPVLVNGRRASADQSLASLAIVRTHDSARNVTLPPSADHVGCPYTARPRARGGSRCMVR